jgi:phospholipid-binding lipoprotein MlaA
MSFLLFVAAPISVLAQGPLESINKDVFALNDYFDALLVKPVSMSYTTIVPNVAQRAVGNFFSNIDDVNVMANELLQLKLSAAASDCGRLLLNSIVGVGGLFDVASGFGLNKHNEDFGQTLGRWGVGSGAYVVLPVFGSSSVRDSFGLIVDTLFNPLHYIDDSSMRLSLYSMRQVDSRSSITAFDDSINGDRYVFYREAYSQRRDYLVRDGAVENMFEDF